MSDNKIEQVKKVCRDFALLNGLILKSHDLKSINTVPLTLFPSPFPETFYKNAIQIQKDFNVLFNKLSRDYDTMKVILEKVIMNDDYVKRLWSIYEVIRTDKYVQPIFLGLIRNDYMVHVPADYRSQNYHSIEELNQKPGVSLKQIEYNLMASSFGGLSQRLTPFHKVNASIAGLKYNDSQIPCNKPADGLARGLIRAWEVYGKSNAIILFLVSPNERNVFDQRQIELSIYEQKPEVQVRFQTFESCLQHGKMDDNLILRICNDEVAVIYFRHGYIPSHFYSEEIWESKLMLERCRAIKCPSIQMMLTNTKLVQQALCDYSLLVRYCPDSRVARELAETFAGQYLLTDPEPVAEALARPEDFVLKPQREGGGNNYFGAELVTKLSSVIKSEEKHDYVLMQLIQPPLVTNHMLHPSGEITEEKLITELGIYGVFLGGEKDVYANYQCGHLLRSKKLGVNESGIAANFGCLDSPLLV